MNRAFNWCLTILCVIATAVLYGGAMWDHGYKTGIEEPKMCARVPGKEVVSSTADVCTYANSFGRSTTKRRAG